MKSLDRIFAEIDDSYDAIVETMIGMIRIPALAPVNGGDGESLKADYLQQFLSDFDEVQRIDIPDEWQPDVMRPNILARKHGKQPGTVWIVAHTDVVPAGDPELWDTPPFDPVFKNGKIYGRGTEDNGQSVISSMFASRPFLSEELNGMSIGLAYVADEETTSKMGICRLLEMGFFSKDDVVFVPDWGSPNGSMIEIAEKNLLWLRFDIEGKTAHGSSPHRGLNAYAVSTRLLCDLMDEFPKRFPEEDPSFRSSVSTFEPTKRPATVENVNTIPGKDSFYMDIRTLPIHSIDDVFAVAKEVAQRNAESSGARITVSEVQRHSSGKASSLESKGLRSLVKAVESITGNTPDIFGIGGATCANFFRLHGLDAYVWQCGGGTLHAPNEYVEVANIITDAKVFATVFSDLCL